MLHPHHGQAEAVARITWLIGERAIGVVTGEVGAGKTVAARAATSAMDPVRHTIIYLANPLVGQRGIYAEIARTLGQTPRYLKAALVAQAAELLSAEHAEKAKTSVLIIDLCRHQDYADKTRLSPRAA
jgi:type II secretory pathway predicted ATPase ExeA